MSVEAVLNSLEAHRLSEILAELHKRRCEAIQLYRPLPEQDKVHRSHAKERLVIGSNRAGKTLVSAIEVARAVLGLDPYDKFPRRDGRCICVGKDLKQIGRVMWPKLFRAGAFKIIRDRDSGLWRAWEPWNEWDAANKKFTKKAPPLIPMRYIESIAWENKKEDVPSLVKLKSGWEMSFHSSLGKPTQGTDVDFVWLDEEIVEGSWYEEMLARILDRSGRILWSATPQAATEQLYAIHQRAIEAAELGDEANVREFKLLMDNNPFISEKDRADFKAQLADKDEATRVRIGGEFAIESFKVFPEFNTKVHCVKAEPIPHDWTRYMVVDPGTQVCAVLFAAVPPPDFGDFVYLYDEAYIKRCSAHIFAEVVAKKAADQTFEAFIMDPGSGLVQEMGSGRTIEEQYAAELQKLGIASTRTRSNFLWGTRDKRGSMETVRGWLRIRHDGTTKLRLLDSGVMRWFIWEIEKYHHVRKGDILTDEPVKKNDHLMSCIRYLAAFEPQYVKPRHRKRKSEVQEILDRKKARKRKGQGDGGVTLGPGASYL